MGTSKQLVNFLLEKDLDNFDDELVKEVVFFLSGMEKIDSDEQYAKACFYAGVNLLEEEGADSDDDSDDDSDADSDDDSDADLIISPSEKAVWAFQLFREAAKKGLPEAMGNVGHCYWNGIGVRQNKELAVKWFKKAANAGDVESMRSIGYAYNVGNGVYRNRKKAFEWYEMAASNGDGRAMLEVGVKYRNGDGVNQNIEEAIEWFKKCIDSGHSCIWMAALYLAQIMENAHQKENNLDVAKELYESAYELCLEAAENGDTEAMHHMGNFFLFGNELLEIDKNPSKAVEYYENAAYNGFTQAMNMLGVCYSNGMGVGKDILKACWCFELAADKGFTAAKVNLALLYLLGDGIKADYEKAAELLQQVSDSQYSFAQTILGICYLNGNGVANDERKGIEWLRKGAENGDGSAYCNLAFCYLDGRGLRKDEQKAFKYFEKGASLGDVYSSVSMAECYMNGIGTEQNYREAAKLLEGICEDEQAEREFPDTANITDYNGWKSIGDPLHLVNEYTYAKAYYLLSLIYNMESNTDTKAVNKAFKCIKLAKDLCGDNNSELAKDILEFEIILEKAHPENAKSYGSTYVEIVKSNKKDLDVNGFYDIILHHKDGTETKLLFEYSRLVVCCVMSYLFYGTRGVTANHFRKDNTALERLTKLLFGDYQSKAIINDFKYQYSQAFSKVDDTIEEACRKTGDAEEFKTTPKKSKFEDNMYTFRSTNLTSEQVRLPKELLGLRKDLLEYDIKKRKVID